MIVFGGNCSFQKRVQNYSSIAQKINANFLCDEGNLILRITFSATLFNVRPLITAENPLIESGDEQAVSSEIERDLAEVSSTLSQIFVTISDSQFFRHFSSMIVSST